MMQVLDSFMQAFKSLVDAIRAIGNNPFALIAFLALVVAWCFGIFIVLRLLRTREAARAARSLNKGQRESVGGTWKTPIEHLPSRHRYKYLRNYQLLLAGLATLVFILVALWLVSRSVTPSVKLVLRPDVLEPMQGDDNHPFSKVSVFTNSRAAPTLTLAGNTFYPRIIGSFADTPDQNGEVVIRLLFEHPLDDFQKKQFRYISVNLSQPGMSTTALRPTRVPEQ